MQSRKIYQEMTRLTKNDISSLNKNNSYRGYLSGQTKEKAYLINARVHQQKVPTSRDQLPNKTP